jgi:hypothetical protein
MSRPLGLRNRQRPSVSGFDIVSGVSLRMSPEKFAPERLCSCMPGWYLGDAENIGKPGTTIEAWRSSQKKIGKHREKP